MSRFYPHLIIAREGWPFIGGGLIASVLITLWADWWSLPLASRRLQQTWISGLKHCSILFRLSAYKK